MEIAALKRRIREHEKEIGDMRRTARRAESTGHDGATEAVRFSPKWLQAHRERLELSAADYAALVGVSPQTIYNWEQGKSRPQPEQLEAWAAVRRLGKREAWRRLEEME